MILGMSNSQDRIPLRFASEIMVIIRIPYNFIVKVLQTSMNLHGRG